MSSNDKTSPNNTPPWCLSAFYFAYWNAPHNKMLHVGYVDKIFNTREEAISYCNTHNAHLRPYTAMSNHTDWDPENKLAYVAVQHMPNGALLNPW